MDGTTKQMAAALRRIAKAEYSDHAGNPMEWASTLAYLALGGRYEGGRRVDDIDNLPESS